MLQTLRVTDFVLFDQIDIEFGERLNVITGETGAGKSILLGAVELILGGEISAAQVRVGAEKAVVEGLFSLSRERLEELAEAGWSTGRAGPRWWRAGRFQAPGAAAASSMGTWPTWPCCAGWARS
ncbi:MAG: AAA family ATPase [Candidatus Glassbacteria bacterium]